MISDPNSAVPRSPSPRAIASGAEGPARRSAAKTGAIRVQESAISNQEVESAIIRGGGFKSEPAPRRAQDVAKPGGEHAAHATLVEDRFKFLRDRRIGFRAAALQVSDDARVEIGLDFIAVRNVLSETGIILLQPRLYAPCGRGKACSISCCWTIPRCARIASSAAFGLRSLIAAAILRCAAA